MATKAKAKTCTKPCDKTAKKVNIDQIKDKVTNAAGKIPQWISKAKKELEALIEKLNKLDAYLAKILEIFGGNVTWDNVRRVRGSKEERSFVTQLMKQRQAMVAYKEALEARIALGEKGVFPKAAV